MTIIEQTIVPKSPDRKSEDGIIVTPDFIAVIDGSTSKATRRYSLFSSNGRYAMLLVGRCVRRLSANASFAEFRKSVTSYVRRHYRKSQLEQLAQHAEERLAASCVVYSRLRREVWMIGDCQCLIDGELFSNPKPSEAVLAQQRADLIKASPEPWDHFLVDDTARAAIIPQMIESMRQQQNIGYSVVDGFPIPSRHVLQLTLDFQPHELVLASDGYPELCPTLEASEAALDWQRRHDPLNIGRFQATKAFAQGNNSFDDRAYVRFTV